MSISDQIYPTYKAIGQTPLESLKALFDRQNFLNKPKATYVGRLDPMAHGLQLNLIDPSPEKIEPLKGLDKTYQVIIGLGMATDSYDLLGLASEIKKVDLNPDSIKTELLKFIGTYNQPYPPFSAVKVAGKPLHYWAKHNQLDQITIPTHPITVKSIYDIEFNQIKLETVWNHIKTFVPQIQGDFRQSEILALWQKQINRSKIKSVLGLKCSIDCSSGTYVRQISHQLGENLGCGGLAIEILRTKIGKYKLSDIPDISQKNIKTSFLKP